MPSKSAGNVTPPLDEETASRGKCGSVSTSPGEAFLRLLSARAHHAGFLIRASSSWYSRAMTTPSANGGRTADLLLGTGYILGVSYPVLALSTGVRAVYQAMQRPDMPILPIALSGLAAVIYLVAAVAFFVKRRWAWRAGFAALAFETGMTLGVGALSYMIPDVIGRTVWAHFGRDYGYFPLIQPVLGLAWLIWPETVRRFGFDVGSTGGVAGAVRGALRALRQG
jgi:hypothetical protein